MITLFQFYRVWGLPNASPFCMKVETYLRMTKLPYENRFVNNPQKGPKRKLPFIKIDGELFPDSELIIDELKKRFGDILDKELTPEQRALALFMDISFSERLYWVELYLRWKHEAGWSKVKETMFSKLPSFPKLFVPNMVRKSMFKELDWQGMGRHSLEEVMQMGFKVIDALSSTLNDKKYFLGDKPSSIDATAFSFLVNILWTPLEDLFKQYALEHRNLNAYCHRMWEEFYPELAKPENSN